MPTLLLPPQYLGFQKLGGEQEAFLQVHPNHLRLHPFVHVGKKPGKGGVTSFLLWVQNSFLPCMYGYDKNISRVGYYSLKSYCINVCLVHPIFHLAYVGVGTMTTSPGSEIIQARASSPPLTPLTIRKFSADNFCPWSEGSSPCPFVSFTLASLSCRKLVVTLRRSGVPLRP